MKRNPLFLAVAAVCAAGGLWFAWTAWRASTVDNVSLDTPPGPPRPGQMLRPPEPSRRFTDFTPEQRVEFARRGHGPGG